MSKENVKMQNVSEMKIGDWMVVGGPIGLCEESGVLVVGVGIFGDRMIW